CLDTCLAWRCSGIFFPQHRTRTSTSTGRGDASAASRRVARFPADNEGLDVVPAIAVGGLRDALLELSEEVGEETGSARLALAREGTEEQRPSPCGDALDVFPREHRGIVVPVGVVETEQLDALEFEAGEAPAARLEGSPELAECARPDRNDGRGDGGAADAPRAAPVGQQQVHVPDDLD